MSRLRRLKSSDRIFFITVNLRKTVPPFTHAEYPLLVESLDQSRRRLGFLLCGYVLMPDHWHALLLPHHPLTISQVVRDVKLVSARRINRQRRCRGPVWQHQFWDRFVRHAKEYRERLDYIHDNPVRKGLVARPEEWRWSSFLNFSQSAAQRAACPVEIDYVILPDDYRG